MTTPIDADAVRDQDAIIEDLRRRGVKNGGVYALTGPGGTGKTHLVRRISEELFARPLFTASTGLAATAFSDFGRSMTIHSALSLGVGDRPLGYYVKRLGFLRAMGAIPEGVELAANADVIFIDEMSMLNEHLLRLIDGILQHVRNRADPFGGVSLFLVGDFLQLPPVNGNAANKRLMVFETDFWKQVVSRTYALSRSVRHDGDAEFRDMLLRIRVGAPLPADIARLNERVRAEIPDSITGGRSAPRLYTHNANVREYNARKIRAISPTKRHTFCGTAMVRAGNEIVHKTDVFDSVYRVAVADPAAYDDPQSAPPRAKAKASEVRNEKRFEAAQSFFKKHEPNAVVELGVGAPVMFNMNAPLEGFFNGTIGWVVGLEDGAVTVQLSDGASVRVVAKEYAHESFGYVFVFTQIPLEPAYAMTVHKAQGRTLPCAIMDLSRTFDFGQGYSAISRVKTLHGISLEKPVTADCFRAYPAARDFYAALEPSSNDASFGRS